MGVAHRKVQQDGTLLPAIGRHHYVNINLFEFMRPFWSSPDLFATPITSGRHFASASNLLALTVALARILALKR